MAFPLNNYTFRLSATGEDFLFGDLSFPKPDVIKDREIGGVAIGDSSQGMAVRLWGLTYDGPSGQIFLATLTPDGLTPNGPQIPIFAVTNATRLGFTFDANMRPCLCWEDILTSQVFLRYFDTLSSNFVVFNITGARSALLTHDVKDFVPHQLGMTDAVLFYINAANQLSLRIQRERFQTEHRCAQLSGTPKLVACGLSSGNRIKIKMKDGAYVGP